MAQETVCRVVGPDYKDVRNPYDSPVGSRPYGLAPVSWTVWVDDGWGNFIYETVIQAPTAMAARKEFKRRNWSPSGLNWKINHFRVSRNTR
jgi:hypothetical protein